MIRVRGDSLGGYCSVLLEDLVGVLFVMVEVLLYLLTLVHSRDTFGAHNMNLPPDIMTCWTSRIVLNFVYIEQLRVEHKK